MRDFAVVGTSPGRVAVGWGPFWEAPARAPGRAAFYLPDYFLRDPHPWKHPEHFEELSLAEFGARAVGTNSVTQKPRVEWSAAAPEAYRALFESAQSALRHGEFQKIVPVFFERGRALGPREDFIRHLIACGARIPEAFRIYGCACGANGLLGASPELLIEAREAGRFRTVAVAGTRSLARAEELAEDPKEGTEHRMVVDDIRARLKAFGEVSEGAREILRLPRLAHLKTPIELRAAGPTSLGDLVRALHPTAALGAWPRGHFADRWLERADVGVERARFGAPFGFERVDGSGLCVVAIRNVEWTDTELRLGSGGGVLLESRFPSEWNELQKKRAQVKALFEL